MEHGDNDDNGDDEDGEEDAELSLSMSDIEEKYAKFFAPRKRDADFASTSDDDGIVKDEEEEEDDDEEDDEEDDDVDKVKDDADGAANGEVEVDLEDVKVREPSAMTRRNVRGMRGIAPPGAVGEEQSSTSIDVGAALSADARAKLAVEFFFPLLRCVFYIVLRFF